MGFGTGDNWKGNKLGRPKKPDFRAKFTQEIIEANYETSKSVVNYVGQCALNGDQWAAKLYCTTILPYTLVKPKAEMELTDSGNFEQVEMLKAISSDKLMAIHKMLSEEINDE